MRPFHLGPSLDTPGVDHAGRIRPKTVPVESSKPLGSVDVENAVRHTLTRLMGRVDIRRQASVRIVVLVEPHETGLETAMLSLA